MHSFIITLSLMCVCVCVVLFSLESQNFSKSVPIKGINHAQTHSFKSYTLIQSLNRNIGHVHVHIVIQCTCTLCMLHSPVYAIIFSYISQWVCHISYCVGGRGLLHLIKIILSAAIFMEYKFTILIFTLPKITLFLYKYWT